MLRCKDILRDQINHIFVNCSYTCDLGYEFGGAGGGDNYTIQCDGSGNWVPSSPPACIREYIHLHTCIDKHKHNVCKM